MLRAGRWICRRVAVLMVLCGLVGGSVGSGVVAEAGATGGTSLFPCAVPVVSPTNIYNYDPSNLPSSTNRTGLLSYYKAGGGPGPHPAIVILQPATFGASDPDLIGHFACAASLLVSEGYAVFAPGFRGTTTSSLNPVSPPVNQTLTDVKTAVKWLRMPTQTALFDIDPSRFGALAGSSSGLIAALLGTSTDASVHFQAVATWSSPMGFGEQPIVPPATLFQPGYFQLLFVYNTLPAVIGCQPWTPASPTMWMQDPACASTATQYSPVDQVGSGTAPMFMANASEEGAPAGATDGNVTCDPSGSGCFGIPVGQAMNMQTQLQKSGIPSQVDIASSTEHVAYVDSCQPVWDDTAAWFAKYLAATRVVTPTTLTRHVCGSTGGAGPAAAPPVVTPRFTG
jgi:hypothetical protein